jgi:serine/threonine protein kinase
MIRGRYEVEEVLGKSEVGAVYLVRDRRNKQRLFVLREMSNPGWKYRYQFAFDSMFFKRPDHMALPHVYQVFNDGKLNRAFMLMDYIEGPNLETLREEQPERRFPLIQVISLIAPIMNAVTHLHSQRHAVIHGDIKPSNIIVRKEGGLPVLVGFSLVKEAATVTTLTFDRYRAPGYKAPEQYSGVTDPRTDIYALGGVLYTLLTGSVPAGVLYRVRRLGEKKPDPLCPMDKIASDIPAGVTSAIHRAMSMHRSDRYSTVEQFWNALWQEPVYNPMVQHTWEQLSIPSAEGNGEPVADLMEEDATELVNISPTEEKREVDADPPLSPIAESMVATLAEEAPIELLDASPLWQQVTEPGITSSDPVHESVLSEEVNRPITEPLQEQQQSEHSRKPRTIFLFSLVLLVTLFLSIGVGTSLWFYHRRQVK